MSLSKEEMELLKREAEAMKELMAPEAKAPVLEVECLESIKLADYEYESAGSESLVPDSFYNESGEIDFDSMERYQQQSLTFSVEDISQ